MRDSQEKVKLAILELNRHKFPNVILVGGTASGKSHIGYQLAQVLGLGIMDLDATIERVAGKTIPEIFADQGEDGFRDLESDIIYKMRGIRNHVIITGAGAVERDSNWKALKSLGAIVCLATQVSEVVRRLSRNRSELEKRPLLSSAASIEGQEERERFILEKLEEMLKKRAHRYEQADIAFNYSFVTAETCAQFMTRVFASEK